MFAIIDGINSQFKKNAHKLGRHYKSSHQEMQTLEV